VSGYRMSLLPVVQYCSAAGQLSKGSGAGRAAAMSSAFHAKCAASGSNSADAAWEAHRLWSLLSDRERAEVLSWEAPADVVVDGVELRYADAQKEIALGLDAFGYYTANESEAVTWGHMDFGWVLNGVAYVQDIKKTQWTTGEGPESLQLHAYARAFAMMNGCTHYVTGLWLATEGEARWSTRMIALDSEEANLLWDRIYHAATNDNGQYATGDHCDNCYQRLHCREHVLPAVLAETYLAPVAEGQIPTPETAADMLTQLQRAEKVLDKAKENLAMWVKRGELTIANETKAWKPVRTKGRASLDTEAVQQALQVETLEAFMKRGESYDQMRWVKR
jgi:hypothetical protein